MEMRTQFFLFCRNRCKDLFIERPGCTIVGVDGSDPLVVGVFTLSCSFLFAIIKMDLACTVLSSRQGFKSQLRSNLSDHLYCSRSCKPFFKTLPKNHKN